MLSLPSPFAVPRTLASYILSGPSAEVTEEKGPDVEELTRPKSTPPAPVKTQDITFSDLHNAAFLLGKAAELASQDQKEVAEEYYQAALTGVLRAARDSDGDIGDRLSQHLAKALSSARCPRDEEDELVDTKVEEKHEEEKRDVEVEIEERRQRDEFMEERIVVAQVANPNDPSTEQSGHLTTSSYVTLPHIPPHPSSMMMVSREVVQREESISSIPSSSSSSSSSFSSSRIISSMAIRALDLAISMGVYLAQTRLAEDVSRHLMRRWDDLDREYHLSASFLGVASEMVKQAKKGEDQQGAMEGKGQTLLGRKDEHPEDSTPSRTSSFSSSHLTHLWDKRPWNADFPLMSKDCTSE
ncbi:MAG: hypothetical protein DHS80DRAFT_24429 [Piptocephalis tieghemiana]|nr:MAG: hypothetical protein DHS80DRAFT_24429 [Piptocephalis tieghemiana]